MEVKIYIHDIHGWLSSEDTHDVVEQIGMQQVVQCERVCKIRDDGRWKVYDFEGQPRLKISFKNGFMTVIIEQDNELVKDIYVDDKPVFMSISSGRGRSITMPFAPRVPTQASFPPSSHKSVKKREELKIGIIVDYGEKCGIAEHTKYFLDKLKCNYKLYPPNTSYDNIISDNIDVVHIQHEFGLFNSDSLMDLIRNLKMKDVKVILDMHTVSNSLFTATVGELADKIIVHNPLAKTSSPHSQKTEVVPLATPVSENLDKQQSRGRYAISGYPVIASFGFINRNKGLDETLEAVTQLREKYPQICFLLVGSVHPRSKEHDYLSHLHNHAKNLGVNVFWKEEFYPIDIVHQILSCADLNCLYYRNVSVLSGSGPARICLASHRPLIVSDVPTFAEFQDAVVRVEGGNISKLADAMRQLLENQDIQKTLIERGDNFLRGISGETVARRFEEIYREVGT